jgi:hypothetical protein
MICHIKVLFDARGTVQYSDILNINNLLLTFILQAGILLCTLAAWLPLLDPVASSILKDMERPGKLYTHVHCTLPP